MIIYATDDIAKHLATKPDIWTWIGGLEKQPPEGFKYSMTYHHAGKGTVIFRKKCKVRSRYWKIKLPYPIGTEVRVKEMWDTNPDFTRDGWFEGTYIYKADYPLPPGHIRENTVARRKPEWHSPVTMPADAVRHVYEVTDVRVCKVQELDLDDIFHMMGIPGESGYVHREFERWYNSRYGVDAWDDNEYVVVATMKGVK